MHGYTVWLFLLPLIGAALCALGGRLLGSATAVRTVTVAVCAADLVIGVVAWRSLGSGGRFDTFSNALTADRLGLLAVMVSAVLTALAVAVLAIAARRLRPHVAEVHALLLAALAGAVLASMARDLVALAAGIELLWLPLTLLPAFAKTERRAVAGAARELVWSGICTVVTLFGFALLAALSGGTGLSAITATAARGAHAATAVALGLVVVGLGARIGLPPLGRWTVNLLDGTPAAVAALPVSLGLVASYTAFSRVAVSALFVVGDVGFGMLAILAALALVIGAVAAFRAATLSRLLAALVTLQAGVLLIAPLAAVQRQTAVLASPDGATAGILAAGIAALLWLGTFAAVAVAERDEPLPARLGRMRPEVAVPLALGVLGAAGAPPFAGFFARMLLFQSGVIAGYAWLVLLAVAAGFAAVVPCMRVLGPVFLDATGEGERGGRYAGAGTAVALGAFGLGTLLLPVLAGPLVALASAAGSAR